jgi:abortive infection bacteriophage resistance protein
MKYEKPATEIKDQAQLLRDRGMVCDDMDLVIKWLETVGYYRLSAYWLPMEQLPKEGDTRSKKFRAGCRFEDVVRIYIFDRKLRLLTMEAIERVEIAVRARWTNRFTLEYGAHGYLDNENFRCGLKHPQMLATVAKRVDDSNETFIDHYKRKYNSPVLPPLWAVTETMTLGELSQWFARTSNNRLKSSVARDLGLPTRELLETTLQVLALVRNICAHHGRLWNRKIIKRPPLIQRFRDDMALEKPSAENPEQTQPQNYIYNVLVILIRLMENQSNETTFPARLFNLLCEAQALELTAMGFPNDWRARPVWTKCQSGKEL